MTSCAHAYNMDHSVVPSRSHPSVGEHPPFESAMVLLLAPFDHVADNTGNFRISQVRPIRLLIEKRR
jgi:hypothetical protein